MGLPARFTAPFTKFLNPLSFVLLLLFAIVSLSYRGATTSSSFFLSPRVTKRNYSHRKKRTLNADRINREEEKNRSTEERRSEKSAGGVLRSTSMRFHFHATKIVESQFVTVLAAFQDESSHDVRFPEEDAGCLRQLRAIWPTDLHAASWDTSNATDLCLCPAYARMAGTRSPGHGVTGELVRENLPPRCRELVACSQTRSRDKLVHELARIGGGGY